MIKHALDTNNVGRVEAIGICIHGTLTNFLSQLHYFVTVYCFAVRMSKMNYGFVIYRICLASALLYFMTNLFTIFFGQMLPHLLNNITEEESVLTKNGKTDL